MLRLDYRSRQVSLDGVLVDLTRSQFEILRMIVEAGGYPVSGEEILRRLWNTSWVGKVNALHVHVHHLRRKLGETPAAPRHVHNVRGVGYRFVQRPGPAVPVGLGALPGSCLWPLTLLGWAV